MAKNYSDAEDVAELARGTVIPQWHRELSNIPICYLFDEDGMTSKGRGVGAKVRKANPVENHLAGFDFILIVNLPFWSQLDRDKRLALLDHELCHIEYDAEKDKYRLVHHDFEDFRAVLARHGAWSVDLEMVVDQLTKDYVQPPLFGKDGEPPSHETVIDALPAPQEKLAAPQPNLPDPEDGKGRALTDEERESFG